MTKRSFPFSFILEEPGLLLWLLITLFCASQSYLTFRYNNYLIFENTFTNLTHQQSLYADYPLIHSDTNHYGPIFGVFIMPFALLPNGVGLFLWDLFNCLLFYFCIKSIPLKNRKPLFYIAIPCLISSMLSEQFNPTAAAFIILSYTLLNKNKGFWSALFIILGTFIKLYGIVGLGFFFFSKNKKHFITYLIFWAMVFLALPMLFSSPSYILNSYWEWVDSLVHKNASNIVTTTLDVSIMGFIRSLFSNYHIPNIFFLTIGCLIFGIPYLNIKAYQSQKFQLYILASVLMFPVLFSSGSEDCTYIIAIIGVGIWYVMSKQNLLDKLILGTTLIFSANLQLLIAPNLSHRHPQLLTMLSVPFFFVWLLIIYQATTLYTYQDQKITSN